MFGGCTTCKGLPVGADSRSLGLCRNVANSEITEEVDFAAGHFNARSIRSLFRRSGRDGMNILNDGAAVYIHCCSRQLD